MKAKRKIKKYLTKGIRKIRNRKGHGVHSPFAFSLITQVINENLPYYAYQDIIRETKRISRKRRLMPNFINKRTNSMKVLFLLYRLVNRFGSKRILEMGNGAAMSAFAMKLANSHIDLTSVSSDHIVPPSCEGDLYSKISFEHQKPMDYLLSIAHKENFDFILIHPGAVLDCDLQQFQTALVTLLNTHTAVVLSDIHRDAKMHQLWALLKGNPTFNVSMDLYEVGLLIVHPKLHKQHYIVSF